MLKQQQLLLLLLLLVVVVVIVVVAVVTKRVRFWLMLREHERNSARGLHRVFGCVACGRQLFPRDEFWACGDGACRDRTYCARCARGGPGRAHPHRLFRDVLVRNVDGAAAILRAPTAAAALGEALRVFAERPCLGSRRVPSSGAVADDFSWLSYSEVLAAARALGTGIARAVTDIQMGDIVAVCGASSVEWLIAYYAAILRGWVVLPLHASLDADRMRAMLATAGRVRVVVASKHMLDIVLLAAAAKDVRMVVSFDDGPDAYDFQNAAHRRLEEERAGSLTATPDVLDWHVVIDSGRKKPLAALPSVPEDPDRIALLLPTSGTGSGLPKLSIITDAILRSQLGSSRSTEVITVLAYEPLRQTMDVLCKGGRIGVFSGSLDRLLEDAQALRPTVFGGMPTLWMGLYSQFNQELALLVKNSPESADPARLRSKLVKRWRKRCILGNRLGLAITGGAPTAPAVLKWMQEVLGVVVVNGYGCTECGGLAGNGAVHEGTTLQLVDCPEMGYLTSDTPPRGEIVAHTGRIVPGYYNNAEATEASFVTIGGKRFFRTGDIGEMIGGRISVIDRKASFIKLAQGVFVSPESLEVFYCSLCSHIVSQIFVHATGYSSSVSAVVVPTEILLSSENPERTVLQAFRHEAESAGKPSWEVPRHIFIERERFSQANGLVSTGNKLCRPALVVRYRDWFSSLEQTAPTAIASIPLRVPERSSLGLCSGLVSLLCGSLGIDEASIDPTKGVLDLGVDSMRIALLSSQLHQHFGTAVPLATLVKLPSLLALQALLFGDEQAASSSTLSPTFFQEEVDRAWEDLSKLSFSARKKEPGEKISVLLTGATGFLGSFLLEELCKHTSSVSTIFCLVRAEDDDDAMERLQKAIRFFGCTPIKGERIVAVAGDISRRNLGVSPESLSQMLASVDVIVHNAALVSSGQDFNGHKDANVRGTVHVLEFAAASRAFFAFVSTAGVLAGSGVTKESDPVPPKFLPRLGGYGQSKWVSEQLVLRAGKAGLDFAVYRPSTIIGHSETGASNPRDFLNAIICGVAKEQAVCINELPRFFVPVPVDRVAEVVVRSTLHFVLGHSDAFSRRVFNVSGPPVSMEEIVASMRSCGIALQEVSSDDFKSRIAKIAAGHPLFPFKGSFVSSAFSSSSEVRPSLLPDDDSCKLLPLIGISPQAPADGFLTRDAIASLLAAFKRQGML